MSSNLVPPLPFSALVPGTQKWGYLLLAFAALVACSALVALIACVRSRSHLGGGPSRLLLCVAVASFALVVLVILEMRATVHFGDTPLGSDWGAIIGVSLALLSSFTAWFAWATITYRWLWGPSQTTAPVTPAQRQASAPE